MLKGNTQGTNSPTTLQTILDQFRDDARNNRDLGDRFERLIQQYLQLDPLYVDRFSDVWMWNDFPDKGNVGDVGVDLGPAFGDSLPKSSTLIGAD